MAAGIDINKIIFSVIGRSYKGSTIINYHSNVSYNGQYLSQYDCEVIIYAHRELIRLATGVTMKITDCCLPWRQRLNLWWSRNCVPWRDWAWLSASGYTKRDDITREPIDQRAFQFNIRGHCIKRKLLHSVTIINKNISVCVRNILASFLFMQSPLVTHDILIGCSKTSFDLSECFFSAA